MEKGVMKKKSFFWKYLIINLSLVFIIVIGCVVNIIYTYNCENAGLLSNFVGMLTDSRSFLSYTRHEYFRRILCELIGDWVENGEYPDDFKALEKIVKGISYNNAIEYFGFDLQTV